MAAMRGLVGVTDECHDVSSKRKFQQSDETSNDQPKLPSTCDDQSVPEKYEQRMVVVYDPVQDTKKKKYGFQAHYNRARALVTEALDDFLQQKGKRLLFLEPVLAANNVDIKTFRDGNWNKHRRRDCDEYYLKHEWRKGNVYIIGVAHREDELQLRDMVVFSVPLWHPEVSYSPRIVGVYGGGLRTPDIVLRTCSFGGPNEFIAPHAVLFETHAGYMSPRQLRANLRILFNKPIQPQTARYAVIIQVFPEDWSAAAVQWRRDESHPDGFQLVAALDFGIGALSTAAKALYELEQPAETHMPAVPQDRWVRHAVVADDQYETAAATCIIEEFRGRCQLAGLWYVNAHSPGIPVLRFNKAEVLPSPHIADAVKEGVFEMDLLVVFMRVVHRHGEPED